MKKTAILFMMLLLVLGACKEQKKSDYRPASTGAINSVAVVMDNELWKGPVGDKVREHFAARVLGLSWEEPIFNINHMTQEVFTGTIRNSRSVLFVEKDSLDLAHIKTDLYSRPQKVAVVKGRTDAELIENIEEKADSFIDEFKKLEIKEAQKRFLRSVNKETILQDKFGISLTMPSVYKVGKQEDNFVWIDRQIQKGNMNIIVYAMPGDSFSNDSTFVQDIVRMRDSIGKKYIPGPDVPDKITYMVTEKAFSPYIFPAEIGGKKAAEVKGIWEMSGYPMAGPYIGYIINDDEHDRKLIVEGFVFAPSTEKRDYLFELEAIIKTLTFTD
ncbi:MAG: DUF4837 family protein [Sediminicola sp.]